MEYICIDLKCFYASCECVERGLDPFETNLVVADMARGKGGICLAVSPKMKNLGVKNRCRLFEIPKNINYIVAKPRMKKYIDISSDIYAIYLKFFSKDDIHVYSIDEVFIDVTNYLKLYKKNPLAIGKMVCKEIYDKTHITATCGGGNNMFLAKIAMDILAKHTKQNCYYLTIDEFKEKLWEHTPLTDFWQIGKGIEKRLIKLGLNTLKKVACCDKEILFKEFGVNAQFLIWHANGIDPTTIAEIKAYLPKQKSISSGQVLERDYNYKEAILVLKEMVESLSLELVRIHMVTNHISLACGFNNNLNIPFVSASRKININTSSYLVLSKEILKLFEEKIDKQLLIRKLSICFGNLQEDSYESYDLFTDTTKMINEKNLQEAIIDIKDKYGKSSVIRGMNLEEGATQLKRNKLIGGHNGE